MFDLRRIPIVRVLLPFAGGSLAGYGIQHSYQVSSLLLTTAIMWIFLTALFLWGAIKPGGREWPFSLLAFLLFIIMGLAMGTMIRPKDPGLPLNEKVLILGIITGGPNPGTRNWSYMLETERVSSQDSVYGIRTQLKVYLAAPVDSLPEGDLLWPGEGEVWQFYGQLFPVINSGNPGATDFEAIMRRNNCWYRFYADLNYAPRFMENPAGKRGWRDHPFYAARIRNAVSVHWSGNEDEISLLKAVCLGDRSDLTKELKLAYSNAGAMHLLAVSGLHMGLIWWVLYHLFSWMVRISGREIYRSLTIIAILWIFAFVTGFSSSVSRSATMFTLFTAGRLMCQRMQAINGILVSAFLLILLDPSRMLDVGFQLSYTAILGIVAIYPVLRRLLIIKNRILNRVWEGALVSFSAQISTAPLVIYYFHQIPVYSLITSIVTIPLLSILIALFVISVPFMVAEIGNTLFNSILMKLAFLINLSVEQVATIPGAVVNELNLHKTNLCLWMAILCTLMIVLNHRMTLARYLLIGLVSASLCWTARSRYLRNHSSEMVIGHFNNASILTFREGKQVDHYCLYADSSVFSYLEQYTSLNWSNHSFRTRVIKLGNQDLNRGAISKCMVVAPGTWILGNDHISGWVISGTMVRITRALKAKPAEQFNEFGGDFVLLTGNPPIRYIPRELLDNSGNVILDGSNRNWYISVIERFKEENECCFTDYYTGDLGAYLKRW